ncbi:MAG: hypothetical protein IKN09_04940, partial [Clostridia bacterium]|nr:hypothetical protein [Clostridia bacterium]
CEYDNRKFNYRLSSSNQESWNCKNEDNHSFYFGGFNTEKVKQYCKQTNTVIANGDTPATGGNTNTNTEDPTEDDINTCPEFDYTKINCPNLEKINETIVKLLETYNLTKIYELIDYNRILLDTIREDTPEIIFDCVNTIITETDNKTCYLVNQYKNKDKCKFNGRLYYSIELPISECLGKDEVITEDINAETSPEERTKNYALTSMILSIILIIGNATILVSTTAIIALSLIKYWAIGKRLDARANEYGNGYINPNAQNINLPPFRE